MKNVPTTVANEEQKAWVKETMNLINWQNSSEWEGLDKDSSIFVKLSTMKKTIKGSNEGLQSSHLHLKNNHNAWGKASAVVDTSAEQALAWLWDYCSNER